MVNFYCDEMNTILPNVVCENLLGQKITQFCTRYGRWKMVVSGGSRISRRGGVDLVWGAMDPRGGYVSKILHVKMKESGPVGGGARRARPP